MSKVLDVSLSSIGRMKRRAILELSSRIGNVVIFDSGVSCSGSGIPEEEEMVLWKGSVGPPPPDGKLFNNKTLKKKDLNNER